jgi:hypothetical protein
MTVQHSTAPSTALPTALSTALPPLLHSTALTALPTALTAALHQPLSVYFPQRVILAQLLFARHWYYRSFHRYIHQSIVVRVFLPPSSTCVDATHDVLALPPSTAPTSLYRSSYPSLQSTVLYIMLNVALGS